MLYGIGVGPGDAELMTLRASRLVQQADVVAYFSAPGRRSNARQTVDNILRPDHAELHFVYPVTTQPHAESYDQLIIRFYDAVAEQLAETLDAGQDVAVLCEGDPFFHGSFMYLHGRLAPHYETEVVPGVPSFLAGTAVLGAPLVAQDEVLTVLPGTLPPDELADRLRDSDATVVMKVGRRLADVRGAVEQAGLVDWAWYVERATMSEERVMPLAKVDDEIGPYFSLVVIPGNAAARR